MTGLRRLGATAANAAGLLLAVVVLNFLLIQAAPGDPAQVIAGEMGASTAAAPSSSRPMSARWCGGISATRSTSTSRSRA